MSKFIQGTNDIETYAHLTDNTALLTEWDYTRNHGSAPSNVSRGSTTKYWWKCSKCATSWEATPYARLSGNGCPGCSGRVAISGVTDVFSIHPHLRSIYDFENNKHIDHEKEKPHSKRIASWFCAACGASFMASFSSIVVGRKYCSLCANKLKTSFPENVILYYLRNYYGDKVVSGFKFYNYELDIFIPSIKVAVEYDGKQWHSSKKSLAKDNIKSQLCSQEGIRLFRVREEGCPALEAPECTIIPCSPNNNESLSKAITILAQHLDISIDINIDRDQFCIMEDYKTKEYDSSLEHRYPSIAKEWHPYKNGKLKPSQVAAHHNSKLWWLCPVCSNEYTASPNQRCTHNSGCPKCGSQKSRESQYQTNILRFGLLSEVYPRIASEITLEKGEDPNIINKLHSHDSTRKFLWSCANCGFQWQSTIYSRTVDGHNCPSCNHKKGAEKTRLRKLNNCNTLEEKFPDIAKELHPFKNGDLTAADISYGSSRKVWWLCSKCGNEYQATPNSRTGVNSSGCVYCGINKRSAKKEKRVKNVDTGEIFNSVKAANQHYGFQHSNISAVCRGERKLDHGFRWSYIDED